VGAVLAVQPRRLRVLWHIAAAAVLGTFLIASATNHALARAGGLSNLNRW
jgi:hypothetical protein